MIETTTIKNKIFSVAEMTATGEKCQKIVNDFFYVDINGNLYCNDLLFAMLVTANLNLDYEYSKHDFQNYKYIVQFDELPF